MEEYNTLFFERESYNDKKQGLWKFRDNNGKIVSIINFINDKKEEKAEYFHENEILKAKGVFQNDELNGNWVFFNKEGEIIEEGEYKNNKYVGKWKSNNYTIYFENSKDSKYFHGKYITYYNGFFEFVNKFSTKGVEENLLDNYTEVIAPNPHLYEEINDWCIDC